MDEKENSGESQKNDSSKNHTPSGLARLGSMRARFSKDQVKSQLKNKLSSILSLPKSAGPHKGLTPPRFDIGALESSVFGFALLVVAWFGADLLVLFLADYIPEPPVVHAAKFDGGSRIRSLADYQIIIGRNLFNSRGLIPGDEIPGSPNDQNNIPVRTTLPINLLGTVILQEQNRSIATLEDKTENQVFPVRPDDEITGRMKILTIETYRVVFVNLQNGRREFVDMPEDQTARINVAQTEAPTNAGNGTNIEQVNPTQFSLPRDELNKALSNLPAILTQARAIPNMENGTQDGYRLVEIVPGSVYEKLGLKNDDILCGVNGEPINDPGRAMEMLNTLKTSPHMELCVKRQGKRSNVSYDIH